MKSHSGEQVNLLGSCFPVKRMWYERNVIYEMRYLKSNEDMILALAGQFKQLSHEPTTIHRCLHMPSKFTTTHSVMRSNNKARISGLAASAHTSRSNFTRSPFHLAVGDLGSRLALNVS